MRQKEMSEDLAQVGSKKIKKKLLIDRQEIEMCIYIN
jgi:hypothetical protein